MGTEPSAPLPDAPPRNAVDRWAPAPLRPYLKLARLDRPIGIWLLLLPCWWSVVLGTAAAGGSLPDPGLLALFLAGAIAMRGAGATLNDILDRDLDAKVERTQGRPLPSGAVSLKGALAFLALELAAGALVLAAMNAATIRLGLLSLLLVGAYPLMKRVTDWPQAFLGLTFNWGALMGYSAVTGTLGTPALLLYAGAALWTFGYDTIYAHQDRRDDALLGIGSAALRLGRRTRPVLAAVYGIAFCAILAAGLLAGLGPLFPVGMAAALGHLAWQVRTLDIEDGASCLLRFRSNRDFAAIVFGAMLAGLAV